MTTVQPPTDDIVSLQHRFLKILQSFLPAGVIALIPMVVFYAGGARSIEPINGQDGYAYIGVVARTKDFLTRFPDSYFGTRFGYVLPSDFFHWLFGFEVGHHIFRFMMLATAVLMMRIRGKLRFTHTAVAAILFSISPIVLVSTFSTYTMSVGALALLCGVLVFAIYENEDRPQFVVPALSSALLAVAWNSHLQLLFPSVVLFGVLIVDRTIRHRGNRMLMLFRYGMAGIAGAAFTCSLGVLILGTRYGIWNPWAPAFQFATSESDALFESSGFDWITWRHYVFLAPMSLLIGIAVWTTEVDPLLRKVVRRMTLVMGALTFSYAFYQWYLRNIAFETFFHSSGLFTVAVCLIAISAGVFLKRLGSKSILMGLVVILGSILAFVMAPRFSIDFSVLLVGVVVSSATLLFFYYRDESLTALSLFAVVIVASWVTVSSPHDFPSTAGGYRTDPLYDQALFSYDRSSMDRASVVDEISRMLPSRPEYEGDLKIWFEPTSPIDQLSGPFLWYRSALHSPIDPPLPAVTPTVTANLRKHPRFVVIIGKNFEQVRTSSLEVQKISQYTNLWIRQVQSGNFVATVGLLEAVTE
jgi:hypothetical protein